MQLLGSLSAWCTPGLYIDWDVKTQAHASQVESCLWPQHRKQYSIWFTSTNNATPPLFTLDFRYFRFHEKVLSDLLDVRVGIVGTARRPVDRPPTRSAGHRHTPIIIIVIIMVFSFFSFLELPLTNDIISDQPRSAKKIPENDHMASWKTPPWKKTMYFPIEIPDFPSPCDRCQFFDGKSPTTQQMTKGWRTYNSQSRSYGEKMQRFYSVFGSNQKNNLHFSKNFRQNPTHHFFWKRRSPTHRLHFLKKKVEVWSWQHVSNSCGPQSSRLCGSY